jgi:RimJ/RimL family protein N-acetyltransferase
LEVEGWRDQISTKEGRQALAVGITGILSENVAKTLPQGWQGVDTTDDALDWIARRSEEGSVFTVRLTGTGEVVGCLLIDVAAGSQEEGLRLRLGYFLSESHWGRGLGSELIEGLVGWCSEDGDVRELIGLVETGNVASAKVLTRNGFELSDSDDSAGMLAFGRSF